MNIFKDPQYAPLKAVLIIVVFIGLGAFALKASRSNSLEQTGQVIDGKPVMLTTLKTGVRNNAEVKALQTFLTKNKLFAGKIDGNFGKDTAEAVKKFQSNYKLMPSGTFGQSWKNENPSLMPPGDEIASCGIDLNDDGVTSVADLDILIASFGAVGPNHPADLDNDQVVGASDIIILVGAYGTSSNCVFVVSLTEGADVINEAHILQVDPGDDTDDLSILAFTLKNQYDTDLIVHKIPVHFTTTETTGNDPDDLMDSAHLFMNGQEISSEGFVTSDPDDSSETIEFMNTGGLDIELAAGEEIDFVVKVNVFATNTALDSGDTVQAEIGDAQRAGIAVFPDTGTDFPIGQNVRIGTAIGEASEFRDVGLVLTLQATNATGGATGVYTLTFTATAFGDDVYVDKTAPSLMGTINTAGVDESDINFDGPVSMAPTISSISSSSAEAMLNGFLVEEGNTEQFTITTNLMSSVAGMYRVSLGNLAYALSDVDATTAYTINLDDFQTNYAPINP